VVDAAEQLGVSPREVRRLIADGKLRAVRPGREQLVEVESVRYRAGVLRPRAGRPLSPAMAWAVLASMSGHRPEWMSSSQLVRVKRHARKPLDQWPYLLSRRAQVRLARFLPMKLDQARLTSPGIAVGGAIAARDHGSSLIATQSPVELYATTQAYEQILTWRGVNWDSHDPNAMLRVLPMDLPEAAIGWIMDLTVPMAVAAADLLDHGDERSVLAARDLLGRHE
jgi:excisionase family DNA binding protein